MFATVSRLLCELSLLSDVIKKMSEREMIEEIESQCAFFSSFSSRLLTKKHISSDSLERQTNILFTIIGFC